MRIGFHRQSKRPCETEIGQLHVGVLIDEQVLRLQISVHDSMRVTVGGRRDDLVSELLDGLGRQRPTQLAHVLLQVVIAVLKDEEQTVLLVDDFLQPTEVNN